MSTHNVLAPWARYKNAIIGRMMAECASSFSDDELERTLEPCVLGPWLVRLTKAARDAKIDIFSEPDPVAHLRVRETRLLAEIELDYACQSAEYNCLANIRNPKCLSHLAERIQNNPKARGYPRLNPKARPRAYNPPGPAPEHNPRKYPGT